MKFHVRLDKLTGNQVIAWWFTGSFAPRRSPRPPDAVLGPDAGAARLLTEMLNEDSAIEAVAMRPPREVIAEVAEAAEEDE